MSLVNADQRKRNYSIDLLRIIAMVMIVFLHINSHGELNHYYNINSANGFILRFLSICSIVAVNIYVLISGYFLINQKFKVSKLIQLLVEVLFYSVIVFIIRKIQGASFSLNEYLQTFLPVSYKLYWFVTAYFGMYLLSPFLNKLLNTVNKRQHLLLVFVLLCIHTILRDILIKSDPFDVENGYSLVWFIIVYIIAAYLRKYNELETVKLPGLFYFLLCCFMLGIWAILTFLSDKIDIINRYSLSNYWTRYNSLLNILSSVFLFISFKRLHINNKIIIKIISFLSPLTLGVYLIHDNPFIRNYIWFRIFRTDQIENDFLLIPKAIGIVLCIFVICIIIDLIRKIFFNIIYKRKWYIKCMNETDDFFNRLITDDTINNNNINQQ